MAAKTGRALACVDTGMRTLILVLSLVLAVDASAFERDKRGRIKRNGWAVTEFKRMTGWPNGRPGYEVDHIVPLARGGADKPSNMQWLTIPEHREKTRWELVR